MADQIIETQKYNEKKKFVQDLEISGELQSDTIDASAANKFLHFFQDNSFNFFYLDLLKPQNLHWAKVELETKSWIPMFHRSVMTR